MFESSNRPSIDQIWEWLSSIPDPEIPVISLTDLGIIRDVSWAEDTLSVTVSPTYSGCPATTVINLEIEQKLRSMGIDCIKLKRQLSPAWSSEWISAEGREKLSKYGIAPPQTSGRPSECPNCGARSVTCISQFGSTPCKAQWQCDECKEPFDYFKCI